MSVLASDGGGPQSASHTGLLIGHDYRSATGAHWLAGNRGHRLEVVVVAQDNDEALTFGGRGNEQIDGTC